VIALIAPTLLFERNGTVERSAISGRIQIDLRGILFEAEHRKRNAGLSGNQRTPRAASMPHLAYVSLQTGHWMVEEKPHEVNVALARWLVTKVPEA
jgi:hypothetical protein